MDTTTCSAVPQLSQSSSSASTYSFLALAQRILESWDVLNYAVQHGLGGPESVAKRGWLATAVDEYFRLNKDLEIDEIEDMISDVLDAEFNLLVEDGSVRTVSIRLHDAYEMIQRNQPGRIAELLAKLPSQQVLKKPSEASRFASPGDGQDNDDSDDADDGDCTMDSSQSLNHDMQILSIDSSGNNQNYVSSSNGGRTTVIGCNIIPGGVGNSQPINGPAPPRDAMSSEDSGLSMDESWPDTGHVIGLSNPNTPIVNGQPISEQVDGESANRNTSGANEGNTGGEDGWTSVKGRKKRDR